ncbi:hypothetical protein OF83DRAFT_1149237 [Amylostereum chailletii]|nr:hypothetical protein OF83DRAFT_1149237 [Amylostereum chailletii]
MGALFLIQVHLSACFLTKWSVPCPTRFQGALFRSVSMNRLTIYSFPGVWIPLSTSLSSHLGHSMVTRKFDLPMFLSRISCRRRDLTMELNSYEHVLHPSQETT